VIASIRGGASAFVAGAATVLAFAPVGVYPLALVTLALLVAPLERGAAARCFLAGFWFGLGFFAVGCRGSTSA
jgi:apolipoprotein N-acyltransferase